MARKEDSNVTRRVNSQMESTALGVFTFPNRPQNMLWYLLHKFLFRGSGLVKLEMWDALLKRFVNDPNNGVAPTADARTSTRGNLTGQVFPEDKGMSINTFVKASSVAGAKELELLAIWKMDDGTRIVGKVKYPLTPDVLINLNEEESDADMIREVSQFLQDDNEDSVQKLIDKLSKYKKSKKQNGVKK